MRIQVFEYLVEPLRLHPVIDIYLKMLKEDYSDFYNCHSSKLSRINYLKKKRDLFAHSHYRADETEIKKLDNSKFPISDLRRYTKNPESEIRESQIIQLQKEAFNLSVIINEFRKTLKVGKTQHVSPS